MRKITSGVLLGMALGCVGPLSAAPVTLYSSFFGGSSTTKVFAVRSNAAGEIYVAGQTNSSNLPRTAGPAFGGREDGFVAKFSANGQQLLYSAYIGGPLYDSVRALAVDAAGNAYVVGYTVDSFADDGDADAFVVKVIQNGANVSFVARTFGGPSQFPFYGGDDRGSAVAISPGGEIVVAGTTNSSIGFPLLNAMDNTLGGTMDGFIRRYDSGLNLLSSTYVGSDISESLAAIAIGGAGNITLAGTSQDLPASKDVWVARLNPGASATLWSSTYSGEFDDEALDVRVDATGRAVVTGYTNSDDFFTPGALDVTYGGFSDGFLMRLAAADAAMGALEYCTYIGGEGGEGGRAVEILPSGDVLVAGVSQPDTDAEVGILSRDAFLVRFNPGLGAPLDYSASFGAPTSPDELYGMARSTNGTVLLAGNTAPSFMPITNDAFQPVAPGSSPGFFMRVGDDQGLPGRLRMAASALIVQESTGAITLTVARVDGVAGEVGVSYTVTGGTATPGDYTGNSSGVLSFAAGQTTATIQLAIVDDGLDEDAEEFTVTLSNPTGGAVLAPPESTIVRIGDNDNPPVLSIEGGGCTVTEGNSGSTPCNFVLRLSARSGKTVSFGTATGGGTATSGVDYSGHAATARTIAAGQQTLTVSVNVIGDIAVEPGETFNLTVSAVSNATPANLSGVGTISNDDSAQSPDPVFSSGFE